MNKEFPFEHFFNPSSGGTAEMPPVSPKKTENLNHEELKELNANILHSLKESLSEQNFNAFFKKTFSLKNFSHEKLTFITSTSFIKRMVDTHHLPSLKKAVHCCLGKEYQILITSENKSSEEEKISSSEDSLQNAQKPRSVKEASFNLNLSPSQEDIISTVQSKYIDHVRPAKSEIIIDPLKTFDSFIVGPSNQMAKATAHAVAKSPGKSYPCLYLHANCGLGKTHLLHAIANKISDLYPSKTIGLLSTRDFSEEMVKAFQNNKIIDFRRKYSENIDVLMIDDIHELKGKRATQDEFFHIFNELNNKGNQLVFTSDRPPQEISGVPERIISRLQSSLVVDIQRPDIETRIAILKCKANESDIFIPDNVIQLIASHIKTNIRELEGALIKLSAYSDVMKIEIELEMAKEQLRHLNEVNLKEDLKLDNIMKAVARHFNLPISNIKSRDRAKKVSHARHIAMYLFRQLAGISQREIGEYFGNRKHTTIRYAISNIVKEVKENPQTFKDICAIEKSLK
ncbi:MAG: chromosomal replication initiator protein DnaA [Halobacteriovoraceae bacterium]|nr:chromosomal replication initiator protein DnaA [Halobacteriovoraceae bacterium]